jgi:tRNA-specific 2-thiouridylase
MNSRKKVVVAMSGGVDSSVAAALLLRQGYECVGVFMRLGTADEPVEVCPSPTAAGSLPVGAAHLPAAPSQVALPVASSRPHHQGCCSLNDAADARYVAGLLGIPFYALNFRSDFNQIIDYFVAEYNAGRTPNPCVRCNEHLKFGKLARYARAIGASYVATGHYARLRTVDDVPQLLRGRDLAKDQSYVLFGVPPDELAHMLLPIGELDKAHVRQLASELGLPVHNKPDSQEICFVPDDDYARLVRQRTPDAFGPGRFIDRAGQELGTHSGHQQFTIGQRRGIGLAFGRPVYVTAIDPVANTVTLGEKEHLLQRRLVAHEVNWLATPPRTPTPVLAKVRYNSPPAPAVAWLEGPDTLHVQFERPIAAITPGQAVVCYALLEPDGSQRLLGGGWIDAVSD